MEEEKISEKPKEPKLLFPYSEGSQFYTAEGYDSYKKLKTNSLYSSMDEEPLVQPRRNGINSERDINCSSKKNSMVGNRQSFDSNIPRGRLESDLRELHQNHILIRKQEGGSLNSKVYKCIDLADCKVKALKVVSIRFKSRILSSDSSHTSKEAIILEKLTNMGTNVPRFYNSWVEKNRLLIKMEFCQSSLAEAMLLRAKFNKSYSEVEILQIMLDIIPVVYHLHQLNYVHLDIKPGSRSSSDNILISSRKLFRPRRRLTSS